MYSAVLTSLRTRASHHVIRLSPHVKRLITPQHVCSVQQIRFFAKRSKRRGIHFEKDEEPDFDDDPPLKLPKDDDLGFLDLALEGVHDDPDDEDERERFDDGGDYEQEDEFANRTGRGFIDPWDITDEHWMSRQQMEDLPDWTPDACSRVSLERVQLYPGNIPKLSQLSRLPLPLPAEPHPGHGDTKTYVFHRKRIQMKYIADRVAQLATPRMEHIINLPTWQEKQDAVDELFEKVEFQLKDEELILGRHPKFGFWVERAVEEFLEDYQAQKQAKATSSAAVMEEKTSKDANLTETPTSSEISSDPEQITTAEAQPEPLGPYPTFKQDAEAVPIFMDLYQGEEATETVPKILYPLKTHPYDKAGRMVEEWELSAHKTSKRIMMRQCMRKISQTLEENESSRIFVSGRKGVGKTATLAAIVASARTSGCIVLYIPDGQRMSQRAPYVEPQRKTEGLYDVPFFTQELCETLLANHEADLQDFQLDMKLLDEYFTDVQMEYMNEALKDNQTLAKLMEIGKDRIKLSTPCYGVALEMLRNQTEKPFLIVMDEFNCYFQKSIFYHGKFDPDVKVPIPHEQITLFKPLLEAVGVSRQGEQKYIKRGGVVVAITESHAVARKLTDEVIDMFTKAVDDSDAAAPVRVVEVPRFSMLEVDHIVANFEATGVGMLRFDQGAKVMNPNEIGYLRAVSSCIGQKLLDACMM